MTEHRHTRRCTVRYSRESCAWRWPYPFVLHGAFRPGFNALEVWARWQANPETAGFSYVSMTFERRHSGGVHRIACEARARYMEGVLR